MRDGAPLITVKRADRIYLIDRDDQIVAEAPIEHAARLEGIAHYESKRTLGAAILWMLGFTKTNPGDH